MSRVPDEVRRQVTAALYQRMDHLAWESLTASDKSEWYRRFVADPKIGGILGPHMAQDRIRVWIKDGPAKEYTRALEGVGPYADYTRRAYAGPGVVVQSVLGDGWTVREGSVQDKPMRCWVDGPEGSRFVIWGSHRGLKDLVWQAVLHRADHPVSVPVVVLTRREVTALPKHVRDEAEKTCQIVGAECHEVRRPITTKPRQ